MESNPKDEVVGARNGGPPGEPMNARRERHGLLDREARIERGVAVLEDHLNFAAVGDEIERVRTDNFAIEQELARIGPDDLHDEASAPGLAATRLTHDS